MREIKFRVWDGQVMNYQPDLVTPEGRLSPRGLSWLIIMQFTGLKDKNGKEIYEGDIVKGGKFNCEVVWEIDQWKIKSKGFWLTQKDVFAYQGLTEFGLVEVIGNIYENPELLKEKNK